MHSERSYCFSVALFLFFLCSLLLHTLASPSLNYCRHDQRNALLEFKEEFLANEPLNSWKNRDCSWKGVTCDATGEVISLNLTFIPLNNSIKPTSALFKLRNLRILSLTYCSLYGEIPSSLGNLSHLRQLDLSGNSLVGEVPDSFGNLHQLRYLYLSFNKLIGSIPGPFSNLSKLSVLEIFENQFTGDFPTMVRNLTTKLSSLDISYNLFKSSPLPDMSRFHGLKDFFVSGNSFYGAFTSLFMIPSLTRVSLSNNQFEGPLEFRNISSSSKLKFLDLGRNKFDGPIPKSILSFPNLESLSLAVNNFTGPIPKFLSKLVKLKYLILASNKLEGEIPSFLGGMRELILGNNSFSSFGKSFEFFNLTYMNRLELESNSFRGPLPHWICKLRPFVSLDLSNNNFNGSIPQCFSKVTVYLEWLYLGSNDLSGTLPSDLFFNATRLWAVDVSNNQLDGALPKSLVNCIYLEVLNVEGNKIKDKFPSWLGSLLGLNVLILRSNEFYGQLYHPQVSIGFQNLKVIDISENHFNGTLPSSYFSKWYEMSALPKNEAGYIPSDTIEMVNKGVDMNFEFIHRDLKVINFAENNFCGKIPKSIGLLKGLHLLNLSGNTFTRNIPHSLGNLTYLEELDISRNQLSGQIPPNLSKLSYLSVMNFSYNNLEGRVPQGTQFQTQPCSAFMDNPKLYGLKDICVETHVPSPKQQESEDFPEPEEHVINWRAAGIAFGPGVLCGLVIGYIIHKWFMQKF